MDKFIKTFMAVYETRNFSLAAKQLFISQPSVSVKIHQLEEQLGVVLFERNGHRQVRPTTAATHFYKTAEQLLQTWQQGTQEVQQLAAHPRKNVILGFSQTTSVELLPAIIHSLLADSRFSITIHTMNSEAILQAVIDREIAFGIIEKPIVADYVQQVTIPGDELVLAGNSDETLWLLREPGSGVRHYTDAYLHEQGIVPKQTLVIDSNQSIIGLLAHGIGKTLMSAGVLPATVPQRSLSQQYHRNFYLIGLDHEPNPELIDLRRVMAQTIRQISRK
ncbi:LysR family transcriptional regulator [Secundilactobacillus odoratitofui DSM 19909 = JCM 15043]|uniref:LysR family transcriptional regulator n=1 Tax=Secundilactobacillus odoratitofui DSM 19909 = JCM 15043 TaxID=1423776 RepID=A0A0R1M6J6_9LACO|nr:LysR family transcriptional regulator [Secundilactobacillus odoratitofui]KRK99890.1 LysR family transcriptional regulator [Secundilactobacillus odoratitofui DSM 19909 = JCM 15043]